MRRLTIGLAAVLALGAGLAGAQTAAPGATPVRVAVEGGALVGTATDRAEIFRNVPYAAPPVGPLRWRPPQPLKPWSGERDAVAVGPSCPQRMNPDGTPNLGAANGPTSEDCLQLNVFAPKAATKAPVMVWIHGGGHIAGAGWIFDGSNFARDGVVFVAINYRLGALGYFAHPALTKAAPHGEPLGNYGQMDQIAALQWVRRNIAAFGGDPANVTIFGESAGGSSVLALLATPSARGLYRRAIVESGGGWFRPATLAAKEAEGVAALDKLGVPASADAAQLRAIPADQLAALQGNFGPFADGRLMSETPSQAFADGHADDAPLIIGCNSGEDSLMGPGPLPPERLAPLATPAARAVYAQEAAVGDEAVARAVFRDRTMCGPARWVASKAASGKPAWLYYFSYIGSRFRPAQTRAGHAAEIQYVLEYWGRRTPMSVVSDEDRRMAALMHGCWVAFARTGRPSCSGVEWPAYTPAGGQLMEFGASSGVRTNFRKAQLDAAEAASLPALGLAN